MFAPLEACGDRVRLEAQGARRRAACTHVPADALCGAQVAVVIIIWISRREALIRVVWVEIDCPDGFFSSSCPAIALCTRFQGQ